jgi:hypothetical protein
MSQNHYTKNGRPKQETSIGEFFEPILLPKDPQRAALNKVYRLLMRLADEQTADRSNFDEEIRTAAEGEPGEARAMILPSSGKAEGVMS